MIKIVSGLGKPITTLRKLRTIRSAAKAEKAAQVQECLNHWNVFFRKMGAQHDVFERAKNQATKAS